MAAWPSNYLDPMLCNLTSLQGLSLPAIMLQSCASLVVNLAVCGRAMLSFAGVTLAAELEICMCFSLDKLPL